MPIFSSKDRRSGLGLELHSSRRTAAQYDGTGPTYFSSLYIPGSSSYGHVYRLICYVTLLAGVMGTGHVTYIVVTSLITIVLTDEDANEGDLQFSIPRINARPGKGR